VKIEDIVQLVQRGTVLWTNHAMVRLSQRVIGVEDVEYALTHGEIIEHYPADYPFPSCLVLGTTIPGEYLHIVCGMNSSELWLITAYRPNPAEWSADFRVRKEKTE
jgi:hypothetical protein